MKLNYIKTIALAALLSASFSSCINDDDYNNPQSTDPENCVEPAVTVTKSVADVFAASTTSVKQFTEKDVIEAYVNSSDERGNFFKIVYLQTLGANPIGFSIAIDKTTLFGANFYPGKKVYISLKDLYGARVQGALALGAEYRASETAPITVGRIGEAQYTNFVMPSCSEVSEEQLVRYLSIAEALKDANLNTLIELKNVQFASAYVGGTYFDEKDLANTAGGATNRDLVDLADNKVVLRTSSFANFSGNKIPANSGSVRGILTKFNGVYQFVVRSGDDIKLTEPRLEKPPVAVDFRAAFTENFESYTVGATTFPPYVNTQTVGTRFWSVKNFSSNNYIEMTSYTGSGGVAATSQFIIPVNFDAASTFSFDKEIRYMAGVALKVYYVTAENYNPSRELDPTKFVDITSSFTGLTYPTTGNSQNNFTTAGTYNIPANLTGNGYFILEYIGNTTVTTTIQVDNISVK
jgi:hypothetical protein